MAEITLPHTVTYEFDGKASVSDVARSLVAQERLMRDAIDLLESCVDGLTFDSVRISVRAVAQESPLKEALAAVVVLTYQDELAMEIPALIQKLTGYTVPTEYDTIVTVFVMIIAIYGASALYEKLFSAKKAELASEQGRLINVAGDYINVAPARIEAQLEHRLGGARKRSAIRSAVDFFAPAKHNAARAITTHADTPDVRIDQAAIQAVPSDIDLASVEPDTEDYVAENVLVAFRRHDLDKNRAWAATIDVISQDRKPMHVDPSIPTEGLFARRAVRGDVLVTTVRSDTGDYVPSLYYLQRVYDDDAA